MAAYTITDFDSELIKVEETDLSAVNYIKKSYLTMSTSGDNVLLYWHNHETERNRSFLSIDYNDITEFTSTGSAMSVVPVSASDAINIIKLFSKSDIASQYAFTEVEVASNIIALGTSNAYQKYIVDSTDATTPDTITGSKPNVPFYLYNGAIGLVIALTDFDGGVFDDCIVGNTDLLTTTLTMQSDSESRLLCQQVIISGTRCVQVLQVQIIS